MLAQLSVCIGCGNPCSISENGVTKCPKCMGEDLMLEKSIEVFVLVAETLATYGIPKGLVSDCLELSWHDYSND